MFSKLFQRSLVPAVYSSRAIVIRHFRESPGVLGEKVDLDVPLGKSLLDTALDQNIDGVLGMYLFECDTWITLGIRSLCGGEMACSTCHVILPKEYYDKIPQVTEEEQDMLDAAFGVTV
eukprot:gene11986-25105_t